MTHPSRARSGLGRRDLLRLAAMAPAAAALSACGSGPQADPLQALAHSAESDAALARAVARAHSDLAGPAGSVAAVRAAHAQALHREVDRLNPPDPDRPRPRPPRVRAPASAARARAQLSERMRDVQNAAAALVPGLPAYRAGLVGSLSASCAGLLEVLG